MFKFDHRYIYIYIYITEDVPSTTRPRALAEALLLFSLGWWAGWVAAALTCDMGRAHEYTSLEIGRGHTNASCISQCHNILANMWWLGYLRVTKTFWLCFHCLRWFQWRFLRLRDLEDLRHVGCVPCLLRAVHTTQPAHLYHSIRSLHFISATTGNQHNPPHSSPPSSKYPQAEVICPSIDCSIFGHALP